MSEFFLCCPGCREKGRVPARQSLVFPLTLQGLSSAANSEVGRLHEPPRVCSICGTLWCEPRVMGMAEFFRGG